MVSRCVVKHCGFHCRLHLKQPLIPVLFLTEATTPAYSLAIDIRNRTIYDAIAFAKTQNFMVSLVDSRTRLCIYGNHISSVALQVLTNL